MRRASAGRVYLGGTYRFEADGIGAVYKVLRRSGPLWNVVWLNGTGHHDDLATVHITACSSYLGGGVPVSAYPPPRAS